MRSKKHAPAVITRREAMTIAAGIGGGCLLGSTPRVAAREPSQSGTKVCVLTPEAVEGPFNANDFIFAMQSGADTMVDLKQESGSYLASLVISIQRNR